MTENDFYGTSARAYLDRAKERFRDGTKASLIYAILELRCAIEARMQEMLEPHPEVSEKKKRTYKVPVLSSELDKISYSLKRGQELIFIDGEKRARFLYIPISEPLKDFLRKSGNYLHTTSKSHNWKEIRNTVDLTIGQLEYNLEGTLLGPARVSKDGISYIAISPSNEVDIKMLKDLVNRVKKKKKYNIVIRCNYLDV